MPEQTRAGAAAAQLETVTGEVLDEVQRLPGEIITWVPGEHVWTVMDILCHIREFVPYWTQETLRIVRQPEEPWGRDHTDTARLAAVTNTATNRFQDVVADIRRRVEQAAGTLGALSDADLAAEAASRNPRWGVKPASFVIDHLLVHHVEKHLGQIRRNVAQFGERQRV